MKRDFDSWVSINYITKLEDGTVFDDHCAVEPLVVPLGARSVPRRIEEALFEMEIGEEREIPVPALEHFGPYKEEAVIQVPVALVPNAELLPVGEYIMWQGEVKKNLDPVMVKVVSVDDYRLTLDFNHPLAGKDTIFWVKVVGEGKHSIAEVDEVLAEIKKKVDIEIAKEKAEHQAQRACE